MERPGTARVAVEISDGEYLEKLGKHSWEKDVQNAEENEGDDAVVELNDENYWRFAYMLRFDAAIIDAKMIPKLTWREIGEIFEVDGNNLRGRCEYRLRKHWPNRNIPLDLLGVTEVPVRK